MPEEIFFFCSEKCSERCALKDIGWKCFRENLSVGLDLFGNNSQTVNWYVGPFWNDKLQKENGNEVL